MKKNYHLLCLLVLLVTTTFLASCGNWRHGNFNRQKFTDLHFNQRTGQAAEDEKHVATLDISTEQQAIVTSIQDTLMSIVFNTYDSIPFSTAEVNVEITDQPEESRPLVVTDDTLNTSTTNKLLKPRKNFEKLPEEEKLQNLVEFNRLYETGVLLLLLSLGVGFLGLILFINSTIFTTSVLFIAGALLVAAWIFSMIAIQKVKHINLENYPDKLAVRVGIARLGAGIGIAACIISLTAWIVLVILWLLHVI